MEPTDANPAREALSDEVDERVETWHQGLEARRRAAGLWTTDADGEPAWLAPDGGPGAPVDPVGG